ncbi:MAG: EamA family transporter [Calditrichaeota bacterium]|nr:EamA family transporter [Calditrichota bacterium]
MIYLLLVSFIWAFSFGLVKGNLNSVDSNFVAFCRLAIATLALLPWLRLKHLSKLFLMKLAFTGAIQYGIMYLLLFYAFHYLQAYEVALFTILTPLYVTIIQNLINRSFSYKALLLTLLAITGTIIIKYAELSSNNLISGFLIMQGANLCFAFGQVYYKHILNRLHIRDIQVFGLMFGAAAIVTGLVTVYYSGRLFHELNSTEIYTIIYLGLIASGLGFFLWNYGARMVDTTSLAIFNDLKIPLAVAVSIVFFNESADLLRLISGGLIVGMALYLNEKFLNKPLVERRQNP